MPTALFLHVGGPYDGERLPVQVDADGTPVESYIFDDMTDVDPTRDPSTELQVDSLHALYERETVLNSDGFGYQFRFRGQDLIRQAA